MGFWTEEKGQLRKESLDFVAEKMRSQEIDANGCQSRFGRTWWPPIYGGSSSSVLYFSLDDGT